MAVDLEVELCAICNSLVPKGDLSTHLERHVVVAANIYIEEEYFVDEPIRRVAMIEIRYWLQEAGAKTRIFWKIHRDDLNPTPGLIKISAYAYT